MKTITFLLLPLFLLISTSVNSGNYFVEANLGYAFNESESFYINGKKYDAEYGGPIKLNFQVGYEWQRLGFQYKAGWMHNSSPLSGKPFNDRADYVNDQLFIGIKYTF